MVLIGLARIPISINISEKIKLSLMSQFTPDFVSAEYKELSRKITTFEFIIVRKEKKDNTMSNYQI